MFWLQKLRLRVFAVLLALTLGVITVVGGHIVSFWPAFGVALVAAYSLVNTMTSKLTVVTCAGCGGDISNESAGTYGITCSKCGATTQPFIYDDNPPELLAEDWELDDEVDPDQSETTKHA